MKQFVFLSAFMLLGFGWANAQRVKTATATPAQHSHAQPAHRHVHAESYSDVVDHGQDAKPGVILSGSQQMVGSTNQSPIGVCPYCGQPRNRPKYLGPDSRH